MGIPKVSERLLFETREARLAHNGDDVEEQRRFLTDDQIAEHLSGLNRTYIMNSY